VDLLDGRGARAGAAPGPAAAPIPDADAVDLANERLTNGRLYHHYGLHTEARRQLEELLVLLPEHVEARQQLAEVCRALGDTGAASHHLGVLVQVMRRRGQAEVPGEAEPLDLPPVEEWDPEEDGSDSFVGFFDEIRGDVERLVDCLKARKGER